jgi:hypothetical protein
VSRPKFEDIEAEIIYRELVDEGMDEMSAEELVRCVEEEVKDVE